MVNAHLQKQRYLTCERYYIFELLIFAGGMLGAYTYNLRGGVFCNAQTANVMLMALRFGKGEFQQGLYYLIPIAAYLLGTVVSEVLPARVRKFHIFRWGTYLIAIEIIILFVLGFVPWSPASPGGYRDREFYGVHALQHLPSAEGVTMATTFVRTTSATGIWFVVFLKNRRKEMERNAEVSVLGVIFFAGRRGVTAFVGLRVAVVCSLSCRWP